MIFVKLLQPLNADDPISFKLSGKITLVKFILYENADDPIAYTFFPKYVSGIISFDILLLAIPSI